MNQRNDQLPEVSTELYTSEAAEGAQRAQADLEVSDPEDGAAVMQKLLDERSSS